MALAGALKAAQLESAAAFWSRSVNIPASGDGGAADVVVYNAAMPQAGILFGLIYTNTGGLGGATMTVRDAVGGGGNALSAAAASAMIAGTAYTTGLLSPTVALGGTVALRCSVRSSFVGDVICLFAPA